MNREDLLALVEASVPVEVCSGAQSGAHRRSHLLHMTFLNIVRSAGLGKQNDSAMRRRLIAAINDASLVLLEEAGAAVANLHDARFSFDVKDATEHWHPSQIAAEEVPPFKHARQVLRFARAARALPPDSQCWVARWLDQDAQGLLLRTNVSDALLVGDQAQHIEALQAQASHIKKWREFLKLAPKQGAEFIEAYRLMVDQFAWGAWALPLQISGTSSSHEVTRIADQYERLRSAMYCPLPIDSAAPASTLRRWRRGWRIYEECGAAFGLIASWLRAMASTGDARRCRICYRHLSVGMKRFCVEHQRTANERVDSRELHVSSIYGPVVKRRVAQSPLSRALERPRDGEAREMAERARVLGVGKEFARPVGDLAASLRVLYPLMAPSARQHVQRVFISLLSLVQVPSEGDEARAFESQLRRAWLRCNAPGLLALPSFFRALYSAPYAERWGGNQTLGAGLDIDHPLAHRKTVLPAKLALDLVHLSVWLEVDDLFDQFAYLNPLHLKRLSEGDPLKGIQPMSLAQVSRFARVSAESVRQTLRHANGLAGMSQRRQRVIPCRLADLKAFLLSDSEQEPSTPSSNEIK